MEINTDAVSIYNGNRCNKNALGKQNGKFIVHCKKHNDKCLNKYKYYKNIVIKFMIYQVDKN